MNPLLVVLLLALIALLGAQLTYSQIRVPTGPRIFIAIGGPFIFLGFALGPHILDILSRDAVTQLTPLLALGLGWIGVLFGLQLDRENLRRFPLRYFVLALLQAVIAFGIVFFVGLQVVDAWFTINLDAIVLAAAATASVSTPAAIALISSTYVARGSVSRLLFYIASLDAAVGIVVLGFTHSAHHPGMLSRGVALSLFEWFAISTLLGIFFGMLFALHCTQLAKKLLATAHDLLQLAVQKQLTQFVVEELRTHWLPLMHGFGAQPPLPNSGG